MQPQTFMAGDVGFCHSPGIVGKAIRWGEWLRFRKGSYYNHTFTLDEWHEENGGYWTVIQAEAHGVTNTRTIEEATGGGSYIILNKPAGVSTAKQLAFLRAQVGQKYGFFTIGSIITTLLAPKFINVMLPNTWICSAVAAEGMRAGGWLHNWPDIYQVNPAQLFEALSAEEPTSSSRDW